MSIYRTIALGVSLLIMSLLLVTCDAEFVYIVFLFISPKTVIFAEKSLTLK